MVTLIFCGTHILAGTIHQKVSLNHVDVISNMYGMTVQWKFAGNALCLYEPQQEHNKQDGYATCVLVVPCVCTPKKKYTTLKKLFDQYRKEFVAIDIVYRSKPVPSLRIIIDYCVDEISLMIHKSTSLHAVILEYNIVSKNKLRFLRDAFSDNRLCC